MSEAHGHEEHVHHGNYVKVWIWLCILLAISVLGPTLEIPVVTLITAFGIAIVKAYMVAANFMHLTIQPKYVVYLLSTALAFMLLFFYGVAPDVMNPKGQNWEKPHRLEADMHWEKVLSDREAGIAVEGADHGSGHH